MSTTPTGEVRRFAKRWASRLTGAVAATKTRAEIERILVRLTVTLVDAVDATADGDALGRQVGARLIEANCRDAAVLNNTIRLLATDFVHDLGDLFAQRRDEVTVRDRVAALQGAVAEGFTTAMLQGLLAEQEATQRASLAAAAAADERRRTSEARFQAVFAEAAVGIGTVGLDGVVRDVNSTLADMLGLPPERITGRTVAEVIGAGIHGQAYATYLDLAGGVVDRFRLETAHTRPDGRVRHLDLSMSLVRDAADAPEFLIGVVVDITERRKLEDRLWHEARHDSLTGLPNRTLFFEHLAKAQEPLGVCYIDLDGFKNVNDSLGHDMGDRLLVTVARRLSQVTGEADMLLARLSGDEFVILVERCASLSRVKEGAEKVLSALGPPIQLDGTELSITASIGVVHSAHTGTDPGELMRAADITLYQAKANGRGRWEAYDRKHGATELTRRSLATMLPSALEHREFSLEYQPLVRLPDATIIGFEALARWHHPTLGQVPPSRFIPIAEENGHISALGRWVLAAACQQARRWHDEFPAHPVYLSVNVAATQLRQPSFVTEVFGALDTTGLPADRLQLELTESAVAGDTHIARAALRELASAGVRLAIDDFGTGYSNLALLGRLPVRQLKIDRSFLKPGTVGPHPDPAQDKIVAATISLAHSLDLEVVAEGVETTAQADRLRFLHCDAAQGWLFGKPAPAQAATALISLDPARASTA